MVLVLRTSLEGTYLYGTGSADIFRRHFVTSMVCHHIKWPRVRVFLKWAYLSSWSDLGFGCYSREHTWLSALHDILHTFPLLLLPSIFEDNTKLLLPLNCSKFEHICSCHNFFPPFFCADNFYTSLLLIVCALRWYVKSLYRHLFLEDISVELTTHHGINCPPWICPWN